MSDVFFSTGEASGDAVAAGVAAAIQALRPDTTLEGIGAARMQDAGVHLWASSKSWGSIGLAQALPLIPRLLALQERLKKHLAAHPPRVLVLIDAGAFNVRLGNWAMKHGLNVVYLMPPGSWRRKSSPERMKRLTSSASMFLSPFSWNADNLRAAGAHAVHIGHPALDLVKPSPYAPELADQLRPKQGRLIALLPGSRRHEVEALVPTLIAVAYAWPHEKDRFVMVQAPSFSDTEFMDILRDRLPEGWHEEARQHHARVQEFMRGRRGGELDDDDRNQLEALMRANTPRFSLVDGGNPDVFFVSDLSIVCAGTATLEAAVAGKPMVIVYDGPWIMHLEWRLRRKRVNARFIGMPNIIADRDVVPELIAENATVPRIVEAATGILDDPVRLEIAHRTMDKIRGELRPEGALSTAAANIIQIGSL